MCFSWDRSGPGGRTPSQQRRLLRAPWSGSISSAQAPLALIRTPELTHFPSPSPLAFFRLRPRLQTVFIPIALEQMSRSSGFLEPERTQPCPLSAEDEVEGAARCKVKIAGLWIDTASFSLYTYSISVALQALLVVSIGTTADRASHRKVRVVCYTLAPCSA